MLKDFPGLLYSYLWIRTSRLFDKDWYLTQNPDIARAKIDPCLHYLRYGGFEGRDPNPNFSSRWYLDAYPDVRKAGVNPLLHYLKRGRKENRLTQPPARQLPYYCPVCRTPVENFLPLPEFYKENFDRYGYPYTAQSDIETTNLSQYFCPNCSASDRDRLYAAYIDEWFSLHPEKSEVSLLDIAPSPSLSNYLDTFKQIKRVTADRFAEGVDYKIDITSMPEIADNSFDILICSHVLEHVSDDRKAMAELYRVLKPGGWGIIMVPIVLSAEAIDEDPNLTDEAERWRRFGQDDHVRLYNKAGFVNRLESAGFYVRQLGMDYFGETAFKKYGLIETSVLYIAEKSSESSAIFG